MFNPVLFSLAYAVTGAILLIIGVAAYGMTRICDTWPITLMKAGAFVTATGVVFLSVSLIVAK